MNSQQREVKLDYSIVIPVYNSEKTISELFSRLISVMDGLKETYEIIFVDDCSLDNSWELIQKIIAADQHVTGIQLMKNSGQGSATLAGMAICKGAYVITLDDDLQHPPEEIPRLIETIKNNSSLDVVIGAPIIKQHGFVRRIGSSIINRINSISLEKDPNLLLTGFRIVNRKIVDNLLTMKVPYPAIGPMIISISRRICNIPFAHQPRLCGKSGYTMARLFKQTMTNLIGFSIFPLRILAVIGFLGIIMSFLFACFYLVRFFWVGISVPGWTTLLLLLLALFGFNFFAFAIIGEYIMRLNQISAFASAFAVRTIVSSKVQTTHEQKD